MDRGVNSSRRLRKGLDNVRIQQLVYRAGLSTALILTIAAPSSSADLPFRGLQSYLLASSVAADPGLLVILGVALIGLRVFMARRSKRSQKEAAEA